MLRQGLRESQQIFNRKIRKSNNRFRRRAQTVPCPHLREFRKRPCQSGRHGARNEGSRRARERAAGVRDRREAVSGRRRTPHRARAAFTEVQPRVGAARGALGSASTTHARRRRGVRRVRSRARGPAADLHRGVRPSARGRGQAAHLQAHQARPAPGDWLRRGLPSSSGPGRGMDRAAEETGAARRV